MIKEGLWLRTTIALLAVALFVILSNTFYLEENNLNEPEIAEAHGCKFELKHTSPLNFGALVRATTGTSFITMNTNGTLTAQNNYSVGTNIEKYNPSFGSFTINGSDLQIGQSFEVRFVRNQTIEGVIVNNLRFQVENSENLKQIDDNATQNKLTFKVVGNPVYTNVSYGGTLTVNSSVSGLVSPKWLIDVVGKHSCN